MTKKKRRLLIFLCICVFISLCILFYFDRFVNPVILTTSESKVKMLTSRAVNNAITELLNNDEVYGKLINTQTDQNGKITLIQANAIQANKLAKDITRLAHSKIETIGDNGISIPLGSFTGLPILMGRGPQILIKIVPIGTLECKFISEFTSAGINQTLHRIYLTVNSEVNLVLPIFNNPVHTYTECLICESVIVGEIPSVYFGGNGLSKLLDLVP